ncbi:uncharacterized protein LOC120357432 [Solenopsis invicta]|uniref:uncharacterized protein LOC120357432 n=1 Tax=Solenopsis invicta TaxID=13686 RepID=UPI00193CF2E9|nr:uncharacterized protein LOC120357432 [Solenopsis invicta]
MERYSNEELANMLLIFGECHRNQRRAAALYAERYPDKQHPGHGFFQSLFARLCRHGTLHAPTPRLHVAARSAETINAVRDAVVANPHTSTRSIAQDLQMNHVTVDINNIANDHFLRRILWTDECTFRSDGRINTHNEHHYAEENPHCRKEMHIQGQFHINVWMGILDDRVIGPHFFPENVTITGQVYSAFLKEILPGLLGDDILKVNHLID